MDIFWNYTIFGKVMGFWSPVNLSFLANTHPLEESSFLLSSRTESYNFYLFIFFLNKEAFECSHKETNMPDKAKTCPIFFIIQSPHKSTFKPE